MTVFVACTDCNRVLREQDGPTCPECLAKREATKPKPRKPKAEEPVAE